MTSELNCTKESSSQCKILKKVWKILMKTSVIRLKQLRKPMNVFLLIAFINAIVEVNVSQIFIIKMNKTFIFLKIAFISVAKV